MTIDLLLTFAQDNWVALVAALINFVWVYLEYRASVWLWPVGIVLPIFYIIVSLEAHYYGNVAINVYYLVTSIVGWWLWLRKGGDVDEGHITTLTPPNGLLSLAVAVPSYFIILWFLRSYTESVLDWADALATVISFVGMIWLAKKWREHWLCWIVANAISSWLFYLSGDMVSCVVFVINFVVAILGYINWIKLQKAHPNEALS